MLTPIISVEPKLAQTSIGPEPNMPTGEYIWIAASGLLLVLLIIFSRFYQKCYECNEITS